MGDIGNPTCEGKCVYKTGGSSELVCFVPGTESFVCEGSTCSASKTSGGCSFNYIYLFIILITYDLLLDFVFDIFQGNLFATIPLWGPGFAIELDVKLSSIADSTQEILSFRPKDSNTIPTPIVTVR